MRFFIMIFCIGFTGLIQNLSAQCDLPQLSGVHVVKKGETLFAIARRYNISVQDICTWNNREMNEPVLVCDELVVSSSLVNPVPAGYEVEFIGKGDKQTVLVKKQSGDWHTVRWGESAASIAEAYGYTEARFREFNDLSNGKKLYPGAVIKSTDCFCKGNNGSAAVGSNNNPSTTTNTYSSKGNDVYASSNANSGYDNSKPASTSKETPSVSTSKPALGSKPTSSVSTNFMSSEESAMIDEINLMRSNPAAYVKYVRKYVSDYKQNWGEDIDASVVNSVIQDLQSAGTLSQLVPNKCLYDVAQVHGDYLISNNRFGHFNGQRQGPWTRIKNSCPEMQPSTTIGRSGGFVGNENLVAGHNNVRDSVIDLLIDAGVNPPGHREALLAPEWKYVACAKFDALTGVPNGWIQMFSK